MTVTFKGKIGFFRIKQKYSKSDRFVSVAKGCIHLPPESLAAIGTGVGDKYSVTRGNERGEIVVRKAKSYTAPILTSDSYRHSLLSFSETTRVCLLKKCLSPISRSS